MKITYEEYVVKFSQNFRCVKIDTEYASKIYDFASKVVSEKLKEAHHKRDSHQEIKRFFTGFLGEAALEKLLKIDIIDWSIGTSKKYHNPDIPGYNVGIKTVERNKFPIIFKKNSYPQIICVKSNVDDTAVFVCGLATPDVLNTYQDDNLILDSNLRARGTKTGFYGFECLIPITSLVDLSAYKK